VPPEAWGLSAVLWGVWVLLIGFGFAFTPWVVAYVLAALGFNRGVQ
jgi:phage shock protein PspC (stress-responsive transcriptional regulator)